MQNLNKNNKKMKTINYKSKLKKINNSLKMKKICFKLKQIL